MNATEAVRRLREVIRRQYKALATEASYVHWLRRYMAALASMPPTLPSEQKLERFLTNLALQHNVAASTQTQAFNAIAFFYKDVLGTPLRDVNALRAKRPAFLRHAPTVAETRALLQAVGDVAGYPTNLIARLLYGCGLRLTEPLNLRIKDVDLEGAILSIRGAPLLRQAPATVVAGHEERHEPPRQGVVARGSGATGPMTQPGDGVGLGQGVAGEHRAQVRQGDARGELARGVPGIVGVNGESSRGLGWPRDARSLGNLWQGRPIGRLGLLFREEPGKHGQRSGTDQNGRHVRSGSANQGGQGG